MIPNNKKTQQSISISPALKEWITRYINVNRRQFPDDTRFKSISAFYTYVMEKMMKCFKQGKTLDDFDRFLNQEFTSFYDKITFKAIKPFYENIIETNKYTNHDYKSVLNFFLKFTEHFKDYFQTKNLNEFKAFLKKFRNYFAKNKIISDLNIEIIKNSHLKSPGFCLEAFCRLKNICYENTKFLVAISSILGMELVDFIYSKKNSYFRIDFIPTDLFKMDDIPKEARLKLFKKNFSLLTNFKNIINDNDYYLWMKMANDERIFVDFSNDFMLKKWINLIESDVKKFSPENKFLIGMLNFFEKIHWITIENENVLIFEFCFKNPENDKKKEFLLEYFSKYSNIKQMEEKYQLL